MSCHREKSQAKYLKFATADYPDSNFLCSGASTIGELALSLGETEYVPSLYWSFMYTLRKEIEIFPEVVAEVEAVDNFLKETGFPNFPLG